MAYGSEGGLSAADAVLLTDRNRGTSDGAFGEELGGLLYS